MATNHDQIAGFLTRRNLKFQRQDDRSMILVPYNDQKIGRVTVVIRLEEDGEFLKIFAPNLFSYPEGPHKLPLLQTLLYTSWETKMLQWEYDTSDGEVRAIVEFPIEDAVLTEKQFFRAFDGLVQMIFLFHGRIKQVIETGTDPGRDGGTGGATGAGFEDDIRAWISGGGGGGGEGEAPTGGGGDAPDAL